MACKQAILMKTKVYNKYFDIQEFIAGPCSF